MRREGSGPPSLVLDGGGVVVGVLPELETKGASHHQQNTGKEQVGMAQGDHWPLSLEIYRSSQLSHC